MSDVAQWRRLVESSYQRDPIAGYIEDLMEQHDRQLKEHPLIGAAGAVASVAGRALGSAALKKGAGAAFRGLMSSVADSALGGAVEKAVDWISGKEPEQVAATTKSELSKAGVDPATANKMAAGLSKDAKSPEGAKQLAGLIAASKKNPQAMKSLVDSMKAARTNPNDPKAKEAVKQAMLQFQKGFVGMKMPRMQGAGA